MNKTTSGASSIRKCLSVLDCFTEETPRLSLSQTAEKTGFSEEDAEKVKQALATLFENDASSARPEGSIEVRRVYWWRHNCKAGQYSSAQVHRSVVIEKKEGIIQPQSYEDYTVTLQPLAGLEPEILEQECR